MNISDLPCGNAPAALNFPHFPTRFQAVIWRNWGLIPVAGLASVLNASGEQIIDAARAMGLPEKLREADFKLWRKRGYITVIRRNWHLLPYAQLLELLGWIPEEMAFILKEDDFLYHKLGNHKPQAE
ncbi:MAG: hypothetical protein PHV59_13010, partial [Victivallales bacterium]|nr:hypothetical protein [Victivallales bacterium]